jgi:hypothetical protein
MLSSDPAVPTPAIAMKWRCPSCKGKALVAVYYKGVPYPQGQEPCGQCAGRGWVLERPFWFWNHVMFEMTHSLGTGASYRHLLHPERLAIEEEFEKLRYP